MMTKQDMNEFLVKE